MKLTRSTFVIAFASAMLLLVCGSAQAITLVNSATFDPTSSFNAATFSAAGANKLVIVATGEHNFNGTTGGNINTLTYGGISLIRAVDRNPFGTAPSNTSTAADIWYLDNPAASGALAATVGGNGNNYVFTVLALSGTAPGVGATAISAPDSKSVDLVALGSNSFVVASHAMGGSGNTANVTQVNAVLPATEIVARETGSDWAGHVISVTNNVGPGLATYAFTGGSTTGVVTIAAEFRALVAPIPEPATASLALIGLGGLMMRRRRQTLA